MHDVFARFGHYFLPIIITSTAVTIPQALHAQALEEIVVTAQRREQSLQEVPVSIEAYSGSELTRMGLRGIQDVESFSPSVEILEQVRQTSVVIRGLGSFGGNYSIDPAAPIFADGIHFGRLTMIKGAFMDVERLEILRGPQPIHFGQNATAGAFSITHRKPTPEWEGNVTGEMGNFGRKTIEGGIGGPLTDTFGIRVAGKWDETTGHMLDVIQDKRFPYRMDAGARVTLSWQPTESFGAMFKADYMTRESGGDANTICRSTGDFFEGENQKIETAVLFQGEVPEWDAIYRNKYTIPDCIADGFTKTGIADGAGSYYRPIQGIRSDNNDSGILDIVDLAEAEILGLGQGTVDPDCPLCASDPMNAYNYRLGLNYRFANGLEFESTTGRVEYLRHEMEDPQASPFFAEAAFRVEDFGMWSQEFRLRSETGGQFEWEGGVYYQKEDLVLTPNYDFRAGLGRPVRYNEGTGDNRWMSAFATVTFNFMDNKASIDLGGRYTDVKKEAYMLGQGQALIFDIDPDPDGNGLAPRVDGSGDMRMGTNLIDCATGHPNCGSFGTGFWTHRWRENNIPVAWNTMAPVALGPRLKMENNESDDNGAYRGTFDEDNFDPQVTLRYRPSPEHSLYAKWAKAFKAGGFDTGAKGPVSTQDAFTLESEHGEIWEVGARGTLLDGRVRYGATLFWMIMSNLQGETAGIFIGPGGELVAEGSSATNAGKARNRGLELDFAWAVTDRLRAGLSGAYMDAVYVNYEGAGCNDFEIFFAETGPCLTVDESIAQFDSPEAAGTLDRSGFKLPRTPDYKVTMNMDYWYPLFDQQKLTINSAFAYSDGYITNVTDYVQFIRWGTHQNWDLNIGVGDRDDKWRVSFWGRNLLNARLEYFPEFDVVPVSHETAELAQNNFRTYGIQLEYNYN